jgi:hypothetical protein
MKIAWKELQAMFMERASEIFLRYSRPETTKTPIERKP